ncbi:MAG: UDP-N-acetylmuramate dehydrogenase [Polyangiaceae bacterium]|jgi:UDP-N-acetylmuramate dehydrogenase
MRELTDVPLAPLTTLRIGGPAARMVDVEREADVVDAERDARARGEALFVLGGGSNIVVADEGVPGLTVRIALRGVRVSRDGERAVVDVAAGESWDEFVARAVVEGWRGVECMSGIPGLVGATPIQNVGAYGQEVSDAVVGVRVFDREAGAFVDMAPGDCGFGYRASVFKRRDRWIVTGVRFVFELGGESAPVRYAELAKALSIGDGQRAPSGVVRDTVLALRRGKGMVLDAGDPDSVSAGSFFVNPVVDALALADVEARAGERPPRFDAGEGRFKLAAAWLVERAGFPKGWGEGRVGVSHKHALALVNRGGASARELLAVARTIREGVERRFGVELEPEPVLVGCSWS